MFSVDFLRHLKGKRVVVMGLGLHGGGLAATQWLIRCGARVLVTDLRSKDVLRPSIAKLPRRQSLGFVLGKHRHSDFRSADLIVANPDVPAASPYLRTARNKGIPIVNEATIFFALCPCPVIGVTGTKGKSTVSTLIAHILRSRYRRVVLAGNIRTTAMLAILEHLTPASIVVLELSSWQLEGLPMLRKSPRIAVLTNLLDDHLNQYPSRAAYFAAKDAIWRYQTPQDAVILNRDNPPSARRGRAVVSRRFWFSRTRFAEENGAFRSGNFLFFRMDGKEERIIRRSALRIIGDHAVSNALAAIAAARIMGVPIKGIQKALGNFRGVPGRLEHVRTVRGVQFINDTTATAPIATIAALSAIRKRVILIAGGVDKKLPYAEMAKAIRHSARALIILPGTASDKLLRSLKKFPNMFPASSMTEAVNRAMRIAHAGDIVLLSPGAASFGLFLHEFDRGEQFTRAVRQLH